MAKKQKHLFKILTKSGESYSGKFSTKATRPNRVQDALLKEVNLKEIDCIEITINKVHGINR